MKLDLGHFQGPCLCGAHTLPGELPGCHMARHPYLAAAAVCSPAAAEGAFGQGNMLDDLREVQIDLQQQVVAPLTHRAEKQNKQNEMCTV